MYSASESSAPSESESVRLLRYLRSRKTQQGGGRCHRRPYDFDGRGGSDDEPQPPSTGEDRHHQGSRGFPQREGDGSRDGESSMRD